MVTGPRLQVRRVLPLYVLTGLWLVSAFSRLSAQSSWDAYRPGSVSQTIQLRDSSIRATPANELPTWIMPGNQFPTRTIARYSGGSRPIDAIRREVIRRWALSFLRDSSIAALYSREYQFKEGDRELWLPVQDKVASFFPRELKQGQVVTLYVVWLGAHYAGHDITWAFVVNEFDADTTAR